MTHQQPYDPYLSDLWSLGIILCTMVAGANPWGRASYSDARLCQFLTDPDFLYNAFPISVGAQDILQGLLHPVPEARMTLPTLREAVRELDTFFRPVRGWGRGQQTSLTRSGLASPLNLNMTIWTTGMMVREAVIYLMVRNMPQMTAT